MKTWWKNSMINCGASPFTFFTSDKNYKEANNEGLLKAFIDVKLVLQKKRTLDFFKKWTLYQNLMKKIYFRQIRGYWFLNMAIVSQKYSQKKYKIQIRHFDPTFKDFCLSFKILHMEKFKSADYKYNNIFSKLKQN